MKNHTSPTCRCQISRGNLKFRQHILYKYPVSTTWVLNICVIVYVCGHHVYMYIYICIGYLSLYIINCSAVRCELHPQIPCRFQTPGESNTHRTGYTTLRAEWSDHNNTTTPTKTLDETRVVVGDRFFDKINQHSFWAYI